MLESNSENFQFENNITLSDNPDIRIIDVRITGRVLYFYPFISNPYLAVRFRRGAVFAWSFHFLPVFALAPSVPSAAAFLLLAVIPIVTVCLVVQQGDQGHYTGLPTQAFLLLDVLKQHKRVG